jgi:hypothetical protein
MYLELFTADFLEINFSSFITFRHSILGKQVESQKRRYEQAVVRAVLLPCLYISLFVTATGKNPTYVSSVQV